ncbi:MAG: SCP2 sterol-binding domain-containing protein [Nitrososphaerota archaeon]|nr:SCP2 sterol-binding domain-containing protein [Nitrososphaerota archaeon]MDG6938898.1 SCP2 sterol-binding domain-containing protein [Nitrososphaerota archaeon]
MPGFFTQDFFADYARLLNADPQMREVTKGISTTILLRCEDRGVGFRVTVDESVIGAEAAGEGSTAEFSFSAPYDEWVRIARGEAKFQGEVVSGRMKFGGSMPKMLLYLGKILRLERKMLATMQGMDLDF